MLIRTLHAVSHPSAVPCEKQYEMQIVLTAR